MKNFIYIISIGLFIGLSACNDLDLAPLSEGSTDNWYNNEVEINMSINNLYGAGFWGNDQVDWTDDWTYRENLTAITSATVNGEWGTVEGLWANSYTAITRANTIIHNLENSDIGLSQEVLDQYKAEARFARAYQYAKLVSHYGDVVFYHDNIPLDEAYSLTRTDKDEVMKTVYEDFDYAIDHLPVSYSNNEIKRGTKGAALAFKARAALYNGDFQIAKEAAQHCMELEVYDLYPDYGELFLPENRDASEIIFSIPRSTALNSDLSARGYLPRNSGGYATYDPSWDLLASYLCTDGLPVDQSPLFDPKEPFKNRDPRCNYTIVPFQSEFLGVMYQPHPDSLSVYNFNTGTYQINNDTKGNQFYASFNGLVWKKGIDQTWVDDFSAENSVIVIRYADVLLMYAEAAIELNEIDDTVIDVMNQVRARAYKVAPSNVSAYPAIKTRSQDELRSILRMERRMEFAFEGLRYMDLIRWKIAEDALNNPDYGMLDLEQLREEIVNKDLWFFPEVPQIDQNGVPDFSSMAQKGLIKQLTNRQFDASRQYLWPIPTKEILINSNLSQNPGY
ncbi:RagB/SusD family nutrient uptake outer membrane protein [Echinicola strongylocentroti]|uniref:RagB/SusD family nutrient uptake outer membrane protein n=1 Tax=Echinicola strongylocentroti TaxID=1795355 RepID=A0A2Z4IPL0_9BACT|nr:RagB/SusD family nutrient uptake outer membrane protein [Echinicola strongylocentroti]AWW32747.1 RagB/SusD family nutrient uptake outer membrane protein [Echinicola strongylocentroti]